MPSDATTGTNHARPKLPSSHSRMPARIEPWLLATASKPRSPTSRSRTPPISLTWRCVSRGCIRRCERVERLRAEDERRAPCEEERELRAVVRGMLRYRGPVPIDSTPHLRAALDIPSRAILSRWRSIHSPRPRRDIERWSRTGARAICSRERSGSRCAISPCSTARDIAGCWDRRTESGTAASMNGGCRLILLAGSSALTAGTTIWAATATAWNAENV